MSIGRVTDRSGDGTALRNILDLELIGCDSSTPEEVVSLA